MTDLVERLREVGRDGVWKSGRNPKTAHPMCIKAADRIEQLEAEVKTALHREAETTARYDAKIDALEAEIARNDALMEKAAQAERDAVVKWLMREEEGYPSSEYSGFAAMIREAIEAGEHLTPPTA